MANFRLFVEQSFSSSYFTIHTLNNISFSHSLSSLAWKRISRWLKFQLFRCETCAVPGNTEMLRRMCFFTSKSGFGNRLKEWGSRITIRYDATQQRRLVKIRESRMQCIGSVQRLFFYWITIVHGEVLFNFTSLKISVCTPGVGY